MEPGVAEAIEYASLISDICSLRGERSPKRELEHEIFRRLGWETTLNGRGHCIRRPGDSHWQSMPQILTDFGTAVSYTIGHRYGNLEHPLERNWYIQEMCETSQMINPAGARIATWAVRLGKLNKTSVDAQAITPAAALVAAWLRTH